MNQDIESEGIALRADVEMLIRKIVPHHLSGQPMAVSEFGQPYMTWRNGAVVAEGEIAPRLDHTDQLMTAVEEYFSGEVARGRDALVWRALPEFSQWQTGWSVDMRFHWAVWEDLAKEEVPACEAESLGTVYIKGDWTIEDGRVMARMPNGTIYSISEHDLRLVLKVLG